MDDEKKRESSMFELPSDFQATIDEEPLIITLMRQGDSLLDDPDVFLEVLEEYGEGLIGYFL